MWTMTGSLAVDLEVNEVVTAAGLEVVAPPGINGFAVVAEETLDASPDEIYQIN